MFSETFSLLGIQSQKERHGDGPEADATLNPAVIDAIAQANPLDDLGMLIDIMERGDGCDVQVRVTLGREHAPITLEEHQPAGRGC